MAQYSGYSQEDLKECAVAMCRHVRETVVTMSGRRLDAVKRKYSAPYYLNVGMVRVPPFQIHCETWSLTFCTPQANPCAVPEWDTDTESHASAAAAAAAAAQAVANANNNGPGVPFD